ncbi:hypothetical protein Bbelb_384300 [Branchiostoma belcheri]|nr:hypothetical protein Bbelb_384300 [Branchiostoma belcheri]
MSDTAHLVCTDGQGEAAELGKAKTDRSWPFPWLELLAWNIAEVRQEFGRREKGMKSKRPAFRLISGNRCFPNDEIGKLTSATHFMHISPEQFSPARWTSNNSNVTDYQRLVTTAARIEVVSSDPPQLHRSYYRPGNSGSTYDSDAVAACQVGEKPFFLRKVGMSPARWILPASRWTWPECSRIPMTPGSAPRDGFLVLQAEILLDLDGRYPQVGRFPEQIAFTPGLQR